jgi:hypothetical protein
MDVEAVASRASTAGPQTYPWQKPIGTQDAPTPIRIHHGDVGSPRTRYSSPALVQSYLSRDCRADDAICSVNGGLRSYPSAPEALFASASHAIITLAMPYTSLRCWHGKKERLPWSEAVRVAEVLRVALIDALACLVQCSTLN